MKTTHHSLSLIILAIILAGTSGCATMKKSVTLGSITGATLGAATGLSVASKRKGEAILTLGVIGAIAGSIGSYLIHLEMDQERERIRRQTLLNLEQYGGFKGSMSGKSSPTVIPPVVEQYEVEAKVDGTKLIGPHKVWKIKEGAKWKFKDSLTSPQSNRKETQKKQTIEEENHE